MDKDPAHPLTFTSHGLLARVTIPNANAFWEGPAVELDRACRLWLNGPSQWRRDRPDREQLIGEAVGAALDYKVKYEAAKAVLAKRERELLELKGQCSTCRLHHAHAGPCAPEKGERNA